MVVAARIAALRAWLVEVERAWLGWSFAPPARVVAAIGWRPDGPAAYCGRCGATIGAGEATVSGCGSCRGTRPPTDGLVRLGTYAGPMGQWIRAIKYQRWGEMAEVLGGMLGHAVSARLAPSGPAQPDAVLVVPMPMPWQRRLYRGIDHAAVLAAAAAGAMRVAYGPLLAVENGPPQVSLPSSARGARGAAMRLRRRALRLSLSGVTVVLVDDVRTSGSSLGAAARLVRRLGPRRVMAAVLAVADEPARRSRSGPALEAPALDPPAPYPPPLAPGAGDTAVPGPPPPQGTKSPNLTGGR